MNTFFMALGLLIIVGAIILRAILGLAMRDSYDKVSQFCASLFCFPLFGLGVILIIYSGYSMI